MSKVVYMMNNINKFLSPQIIDSAKKCAKRMVVTLDDQTDGLLIRPFGRNLKMPDSLRKQNRMDVLMNGHRYQADARVSNYPNAALTTLGPYLAKYVSEPKNYFTERRDIQPSLPSSLISLSIRTDDYFSIVGRDSSDSYKDNTMSIKDLLLALCVIVAWGVNFVVIKVGLNTMPPFLLAGLRFTLVAFPAMIFVKPPKLPFRWLLKYGMSISFGQFAFLFMAIKIGMPAGLASLVIQAQAFFTILLGALIFGEKLMYHHIIGILIATLGMFILAISGMEGQLESVALIPMILTLAAAFSWGVGNITNKVILYNYEVSVMSLVVWSALIPIIPFFGLSWLFEGEEVIIYSLLHIDSETLWALVYLAFIATIICYAIWGTLLSRNETWRIAPLSLLVPVIGILSAVIVLGERLSYQQIVGAVVIIVGLLVNVFGHQLTTKRKVFQ